MIEVRLHVNRFSAAILISGTVDSVKQPSFLTSNEAADTVMSAIMDDTIYLAPSIGIQEGIPKKT